MVWIRKEKAGNAPGVEWPEDGAVVEVPDDLAEELLRIDGFTRAEAPEKPKPRPRKTVAE